MEIPLTPFRKVLSDTSAALVASTASGGRRRGLFGNGCQMNPNEPNLHVQFAVRKLRKELVDFRSGVVEVGHRQWVLAGRFVREDNLNYGFGVCA